MRLGQIPLFVLLALLGCDADGVENAGDPNWRPPPSSPSDRVEDGVYSFFNGQPLFVENWFLEKCVSRDSINRKPCRTLIVYIVFRKNNLQCLVKNADQAKEIVFNKFQCQLYNRVFLPMGGMEAAGVVSIKYDIRYQHWADDLPREKTEITYTDPHRTEPLSCDNSECPM